MNQLKIFLSNSWITLKRLPLALWHLFILKLAIIFADYKHRVDKFGRCYYVLPNEKDHLIVCNYQEIEGFKMYKDVVFKNVVLKKKRSRKKEGVIKKTFFRERNVRKAYGVARMSKKVTEFHVRKECFYHTPADTTGYAEIAEKEALDKRRSWLIYAEETRRRRKATKRVRKAKEAKQRIRDKNIREEVRKIITYARK